MQKIEILTELHKTLGHNWLQPVAGTCPVTGRVSDINYNNYNRPHNLLPHIGCGRVSW